MQMNQERMLCANCQGELKGKFCHQCGQKLITEDDKKLKHFFIEFFDSLFFLPMENY